MPLTEAGEKVIKNMRKQYGDRAEDVFYASVNANKPGSDKWHKKRKHRTSPKWNRYHELKNKGPE
jgi:hypothetical protein